MLDLKLSDPLDQLGDARGGAVLKRRGEVVTLDGELRGSSLGFGLDVEGDALEGEGVRVWACGEEGEHARDQLCREERSDGRSGAVVGALAEEASRVDAVGFGDRLSGVLARSPTLSPR